MPPSQRDQRFEWLMAERITRGRRLVHAASHRLAAPQLRALRQDVLAVEVKLRRFQRWYVEYLRRVAPAEAEAWHQPDCGPEPGCPWCAGQAADTTSAPTAAAPTPDADARALR